MFLLILSGASLKGQPLLAFFIAFFVALLL